MTRPALIARLTAVLSIMLSGCTVIGSNSLAQIEKAGGQRTGIYYSLPMGVVDVSLFVKQEAGDFRVVIGSVKFLADPRQRYLMQYRPLPNYEDDIQVSLNSQSFLSKVWATTEDKTDEIIVEVAKLFRGFDAFQSAPAPDGYQHVATITMDPSAQPKFPAVAAFLSERAQAFSKRYAVSQCSGDAAKAAQCQRFLRYAKGLRIDFDVAQPLAVPETKPADCTAGLCYRVKEPYVVKTEVDGVRRASIIYLPNKAPLVEIDISRALFIQKIQKIEFDSNGFLKSAQIDKPSEALAVSALPLAVVTAISSTMPIRLTVLQKQTDLAEAEAAEVDAKHALADARAEAAKEPN